MSTEDDYLEVTEADKGQVQGPEPLLQSQTGDKGQVRARASPTVTDWRLSFS